MMSVANWQWWTERLPVNTTIRNLLIAQPSASDEDVVWATSQATIYDFIQCCHAV
jgi:hypothetical protein